MITLPKHKHTFVIRFPWSAAARLDVLPVPYPRLTAQQLSGGTKQGGMGWGGGREGERGAGGLKDDWCNRELNEKATVCIWYVLGLPSFEGQGEGKVSCHTFSAPSTHTLLLSASDVKARLFSCHVACWNIEPMMALWSEGCGVCRLICRRIKGGEEEKRKSFLLSQKRVLMFQNVVICSCLWLHNLVQTKNGNLRAGSWYFILQCVFFFSFKKGWLSLLHYRDVLMQYAVFSSSAQIYYL